MIIEPTCPNCGKKVKVNVKKIDRLNSRIAELENEVRTLRTLLDVKDKRYSKSSIGDLLRSYGI